MARAKQVVAILLTTAGVSGLECTGCPAAPAAEAPLAYSAEMVVVVGETTSRKQLWSDGVRTKAESVAADGVRFGTVSDSALKMSWTYGRKLGCVEAPLPTMSSAPSMQEELVGTETIDGHPTKKYRMTITPDDGTQKKIRSAYEWRATDLQGLVIQRLYPEDRDGRFQVNLYKVQLGPPDPKLLALPPQCSTTR